jgi:hypothetical protein
LEGRLPDEYKVMRMDDEGVYGAQEEGVVRWPEKRERGERWKHEGVIVAKSQTW